MAIKPIPDGYTTVTPWLISRDTARLIAYLTEEVSLQDMERRLSDPAFTEAMRYVQSADFFGPQASPENHGA